MKRSIIDKILVFLIILGSLCLGYYNLKNNNEFFKASAVNIVTIFIAVFISYYLVQEKSKLKNRKESLLNIVNKLEKTINEKDAYYISANVDSRLLTMRNRRIDNKISILTRYAKTFNFINDCNLLKSQFDQYNDHIGNHLDDLTYLSNSHMELKRHIEVMDDKLDEIRMILAE